ncbi:DUF4383 domain-containing protein [Hoyosella rhizosphaerae]|uniref:DUF4383 domain-containing protein n=1 Tax=Hoyosella rhizosphaerae TaxID=1755582 RepID=A0A916UHR1_9ACTN|nr:DUF4383 domain-containing protein [Hoyosella rhizosphaerae]MBN4928136.1 DUF4383 domain-containing protein [Hoyosella rhizosphaerae]GGC72687.1 hypothetical protein GCM10011410_27180 [Hoyosella rhizosphaerae]
MFRSVNQPVGYVFGAVYVVVGILGFTVSGGHDVAGAHGGELFGVFGVNALHNVVHIGIGVALIAGAAAGALVSRRMNVTVGVMYLFVGFVGPIISTTSLNILALNGPDHVLHVVSAAVLIGFGLLADSPVVRRKSVNR